MLEELLPLEPVHFFAFQVNCPYVKNHKLEKKHLLPDLSSFYKQKSFAELFIGWNEKGIVAHVRVNGRFDQPDFPNFAAADSIEFFFDTRDVKTTGYPTKFCHHFYFLPTALQTNGEPIQAAEITRFRTEDVHELCNAALLEVSSEQEKKSTLIKIFIPSECLYGYDPTLFDRLGFTYRLNRKNGSRQYFSAGVDFNIENQPSLWASLKLVKE